MIVTFVILKVMQLVVRVKPTEEEMATLDMSIHGEVAYPDISPTHKPSSQMGTPKAVTPSYLDEKVNPPTI
jgi:hypothetical protein